MTDADSIIPAPKLERCPTHPGALLDGHIFRLVSLASSLIGAIPATGKSKAEIARLLGISRQYLYDIMRGKKPVTPHMAALLGKMFGDGAAIWLASQAAIFSALSRLGCAFAHRLL